MSTVTPQLKQIFSAYVDSGTLSDWTPSDPTNFGIRAQIFIGTSDDPASDAFDVVVCSPRWLEAMWPEQELRRGMNTPEVRFGITYLLMKRWNYEALEDSIVQLLSRIQGPTWAHVANQISRYLPWEFDYRFDEDV